MIHYGVSFFMLEKLGAVVGVSNLHIYAAMRGETLDEFRKTRNAPGALYSVAGVESARERPSWELLQQGRRTARIMGTMNPLACYVREAVVRMIPVKPFAKFYVRINRRAGTDMNR